MKVLNHINSNFLDVVLKKTKYGIIDYYKDISSLVGRIKRDHLTLLLGCYMYLLLYFSKLPRYWFCFSEREPSKWLSRWSGLKNDGYVRERLWKYWKELQPYSRGSETILALTGFI
ncbi:hypothetical protein [Bacillus sp. AK031]